MKHHFTKPLKSSGGISHCVHCDMNQEDFDRTPTPCVRAQTTEQARAKNIYTPSPRVIYSEKGCKGLYCATALPHQHKSSGAIVYL